MKNTITKISLFIVMLIGLNTYAQYRFEFGMSAGVANYLGDIGGGDKTRRDFIFDMKMAKSRQAVSGFIRYKVLPGLSLKAELTYLRISGDDALSANPARHLRNLNFTNDMFELATQAQIKIYEDPSINSSKRFKIGMRAYIGGGIGAFYSNPKTKFNGGSVALRPLETEGVSYGAMGICIPVSGGVAFTLKKHHRIGWEIGWRTTFTDYLDDVSTVYANGLTGTSADLANRTGEVADAESYGIDLANYGPSDNGTLNKRGDPTHNDSYLTMNISYSYVFRGQSAFYRSKYGSFFSKTAKKGRKIRAKF